MGCAGDPNVRTPNLDRLADRGVRFTSACSTYPLCVPFRFTMLTGEYAHTRWVPALNWRMSPVERTIAHRFNEAGYATCYIGKWHLNGSVFAYGPDCDSRARAINRVPVLPGYRGGFEVWHGFNLRNGYYDTCCFHGDDPTPVPLGKYQTDALFDIAVDYVGGRDEEDTPFFMALSLEAPHPPHEAPREHLERVRGRELVRRPNFSLEPPGDGIEYAEHARFKESHLPDVPIGYYAQIEDLDDNLGRLMQALERSGSRENTVVLFFSDHGEMLGSHGFYQKQLPQEESINIPFVVYDPRQNSDREGSVLTEPICTEDIYPTTLALAGLEPEPSKPGLDLTAYMRGDKDRLEREGVYLEFVEEDRPTMVFYGAAWRGLRTRRYKYTVYNGRPWQLYDLLEDPYEMDNLIDSAEHQAVRAHLHAEVRKVAAESDDSFDFRDQA